MKTGPVMITLSFLLIAALSLDALKIQKILNFPAKKMNWTEARLYCQEKHTDLFTGNLIQIWQLVDFMADTEVEEVWIGLHRDPEDESVWKWIDLKGVEGISRDDLSQDSYWAKGEQKWHCAFVSDDLNWYRERCSNKHHFYCSVENNIQYYNKSYGWWNASNYCREENGDLATITTTEELKGGAGWIGLYQGAGESWKWIGDQPSDYRNWAPGQPHNTDCGSLNLTSREWNSNVCSEELEFVCYKDNLVVVNENKTWEEALLHCENMETPCENSRSCRHELLSLGHWSDYRYVRKRIYRATTDEVWTSLRFLGGEWWWVTEERKQDRRQLPDCPSHWKYCGIVSKYDTNNWITRDCSERRNFICYRYEV